MVALLTAAANAAEDTNRFHSPTAGFTIVKPASWQFASVEQIATNRAVARLKDEELEELVRQKASTPLVVITKHPEPHDDLNPSTQVILRPIGQMQGQPPVELLRMATANLERGLKDFTFVDPVKETKVGGLPAATMKAKYTVANAEGREFKTLSRMWMVPRGAFLFMISMSGPQGGPDVSEKEFATILESIRIEK
jgi:hypothetical protein